MSDEELKARLFEALEELAARGVGRKLLAGIGATQVPTAYAPRAPPHAGGSPRGDSVAIPPRPADGLTGLLEKLVRQANKYRNGPVTTKALINRTGHPVNAWSRKCVRYLCAWGDLKKWPGYQGITLPPEPNDPLKF